jgi:hypothetical protein
MQFFQYISQETCRDGFVDQDDLGIALANYFQSIHRFGRSQIGLKTIRKACSYCLDEKLIGAYHQDYHATFSSEHQSDADYPLIAAL